MLLVNAHVFCMCQFVLSYLLLSKNLEHYSFFFTKVICSLVVDDAEYAVLLPLVPSSPRPGDLSQ